MSVRQNLPRLHKFTRSRGQYFKKCIFFTRNAIKSSHIGSYSELSTSLKDVTHVCDVTLWCHIQTTTRWFEKGISNIDYGYRFWSIVGWWPWVILNTLSGRDDGQNFFAIDTDFFLALLLLLSSCYSCTNTTALRMNNFINVTITLWMNLYNSSNNQNSTHLCTI